MSSIFNHDTFHEAEIIDWKPRINSDSSTSTVFSKVSNISDYSANTDEIIVFGDPVFDDTEFRNSAYLGSLISGQNGPAPMSPSLGGIQERQKNDHPTPSSLSWGSKLELMIPLYRLVVDRSREPYLQLKSTECPITRITPRVVYLDKDENCEKGVHSCQFPDHRCWGKNMTRPSFRRPADLERHYKVVHSDDNKWPCDYPKCIRHVEPFKRKDHLQNHYRLYHKEDFMKETLKKPAEEAREAEWKVDTKWWRCFMCLDRHDIEKIGWKCSKCGIEQDRFPIKPCDKSRQQFMALFEDFSAGSLSQHDSQELQTDERHYWPLKTSNNTETAGRHTNEMERPLLVDKSKYIVNIQQNLMELEEGPPLQRTVSIPASNSSDPSDAFETDSCCSDESAELDDFSINDFIQALDATTSKVLDMKGKQQELLLQSSLNPTKIEMLDRLMEDFWEIFNEGLTTAFRKRDSGSSDTSSSPASNSGAKKDGASSESSNSTKSNPNGSSNKIGARKFIDRDGEESEDRDDVLEKENKRGSKRRKPNFSFTCPYRKRNSLKYNHRNRPWRTCALNSFQDIARIKGHLYRHHRIFQCMRCKTLFTGQNVLNEHILAVQACNLKDADPEDGITDEIEKKLRCKKKAHKHQSEAERWVDIYKVLFPGEEVPSPYFEEIQEDLVGSLNSYEFSNYEQFSRQELPRIFRDALEMVIANETQPLEERIRGQLVGLIRDCQDRVFSAYRSSRGNQPRPASRELLSQVGMEESYGLYETMNLYTRPESQASNLANMEMIVPMTESNTKRKTASRDSGYTSDPSSLDMLISGEELDTWENTMPQYTQPHQFFPSNENIDLLSGFLSSSTDNIPSMFQENREPRGGRVAQHVYEYVTAAHSAYPASLDFDFDKLLEGGEGME